jgi:ADP-ribose pyrophosphatase YjhB (NUDIX family)
MSLRPDLTVAAVVERDGRFLLVEERIGQRLVFNQPAGHVEHGEDLVTAVIREALEETAWTFEPEHLIGVYFWDQPEKQRTYMRFAFAGKVTSHDPHRRLDRGIERSVWLTHEQIRASSRLRTPMVLRCIEDYISGRRYPLELVREFLSFDVGRSVVSPLRVADAG